MSLSERFSKMENSEIFEVLKNRSEYTEEAISVAKNELSNRGCFFEDNPLFGESEAKTETEKDWWYSNEGDRCGPLSSIEIKELLCKKIITPETLLWRKDYSDWLPITKSEFADLFTIPPPVPVSSISHSTAWSLAFAPLYFLMLDMLGLYVYLDDRGLGFMYYIITISVNMALWYIDKNKLKKSGYIVDGWMWWGLFLVPVYLFVRASKLDKKYAYAIVNLVLVFLPVLINTF